MEHYRSTLAVTAIAVSSLLCASLFFQTGPFGARSERPGTAMASAVTGHSWSDPPRFSRSEGAAAREEPATQPSLAPSLTMLPPPAPSMPVGAMTPRSEQPRKVVEAHRKRASQRSARARQIVPERGRIVEAAAVGQPAPAGGQGSGKGIDLIGDLIRGLGIGRGQQG